METISRWGPVIVWAGVIFALSSISVLPKAQIIWWDFILKKTAHVIEYAIFFYLFIKALTNSSSTKVPKKIWLIAFIVSIAYALSDEYHQSFVLGRTAKLTDIGFDTLGMILSQKMIRDRLPRK